MISVTPNVNGQTRDIANANQPDPLIMVESQPLSDAIRALREIDRISIVRAVVLLCGIDSSLDCGCIVVRPIALRVVWGILIR